MEARQMNDEKNKPEPIQELIDKWNKMPRLSKSQPPATEKPSVLPYDLIYKYKLLLSALHDPRLDRDIETTSDDIKHNLECFYNELIATQQSEIARLKAELKYRFVRFEEEQSKAESLKAELEEAESDRNLFAEWIRLNRWRNDIVTFERWEKTFSHGSEYKTTSELYDIYQSQKQKR